MRHLALGAAQLLLLLLSHAAGAQVTAASLGQYLDGLTGPGALGLKYPERVKEFYAFYHFRLAWVRPGQAAVRNQLFHALADAASFGLQESDYRQGLIPAVVTGQPLLSVRDSMAADLRLTDAALHFLADIQQGGAPALSYKGLRYQPGTERLPGLLVAALESGRFTALPPSLEPTSTEYRALKRLLVHFEQVMRDSSFLEVRIYPRKKGSDTAALLQKLYQLGITPRPVATPAGPPFTGLIREAQRLLNLPPDGRVGAETRRALDVPLSRRREALQRALLYLRWLHTARQKGALVLVNIPSASLFYYRQDRLLLASRIIAGKPSTPTPTLSSAITEVVLYPYWNVPQKIAVGELLPLIQQDPGYLEANNFQVLDKQGRLVSPLAVPWQTLGRGNFPYMIRQSTGCDNSLGLVKLNFSNPFSVYLHDTPWKGGFLRRQRFLSHGCMRVEKALELARMLLKGHTGAIDTLTGNCLVHQSPVTLPATAPVPLLVLYSTAWYDPSGRVVFFPDVYGRWPSAGNARVATGTPWSFPSGNTAGLPRTGPQASCNLLPAILNHRHAAQ
ncbi:L,D-transpeptidase family protein [Paraflavisolibacter sp. H34]|uniref:L,D-transpeptidase family protein n=1 Tax=Huijunlia imazamoxiresistens TaxID=3127457 RepID=UPI0030191911